MNTQHTATIYSLIKDADYVEAIRLLEVRNFFYPSFMKICRMCFCLHEHLSLKITDGMLNEAFE